MIELIEANWLVIVIALLIGLVVAWYVFHATRRTRVTGASRDVLDDGVARAVRNAALVGAMPAAPREEPVPIPPVTPYGLAGIGTAVAAGAEDAKIVADAGEPGDDLARIKGVGPKLVTRLNELGVTRFAQIAAWDDAEIDRIDAQLGRFQGRIRRDEWVVQAKLLAKDDTAGFAKRFGKLS